jgi:hypothetical protein
MTCPRCRTAGDMVTHARCETDIIVRRQLLPASAILHAQCRGGTWCDCQHRVPELETQLETRDVGGVSVAHEPPGDASAVGPVDLVP